MQEIRGHEVNDNYFKYQTHNMAYILGFLASDGCVSSKTNHFYIDLKREDEEILYQIKEEIGFTGPIQHYVNNNGCEYSRLRVCSKIMKEDLSIYGIIPKKTFTLQPPEFLDKKYYISYIRGYFDGDGCFYANFEKHKFNWYICGAKKDLLEWIRSILLNQYGLISYLHTSSKILSQGDPFYTLQIYKKDTIVSLFENLYIPNTLYMKRKYQKMKNFYEINSKRLYSSRDEEKRYAELIQNEV